jgi:N-acetylmuramoyl-L-alanine amidase
MKILYVLLDNGHGSNILGKRSGKLADGRQLFEWKFCREVVDALYDRLKVYKQFVPIKITPENTDINLTTRVNRINQYCRKYGASNCIMISVHVNASGNGQWMTGRGWSTWTTKGQNISDKLAECLYEGADYVINQNKEYINSFKGQTKQKPIREDKSDNDRDWEASYQIIKGANCAATLSENFFMDNKQDCEYLLSPRGLNDVICIHMKGIEIYYNKIFNK